LFIADNTSRVIFEVRKMKEIDNIANDMSYRFKQPQEHKLQKNNPLEAYRNEILDSVAITNSGQLGMKVVFHSISMQVSSSFNEIKPLSNEEIEERNDSLFDFEKVAENVLNFISGRIHAAKENGKSDDELNEMFSQARSGVALGFEQAIGELDELAVLDDELSAGIEKSRVLIFQGIDDLEESYFPKDEGTGVLANSVNVNQELYAQSSRTSDLTVTTADGDKVNISFSDFQESSQSEKYYSGDNKESFQYSTSNYRETSFSYSIEGDIDKDEQKAISSLIKDINHLQKEFFNGDVEKAFEYAQKLGFDSEQISDFSLELYKTQTTRVSQTYTEVADFDEKPAAKADKNLRPLLDFVGQLQELQQRSDKILSKQEDAFTKLFDKVFTAEFMGNEHKLKQHDKMNELVDRFLK